MCHLANVSRAGYYRALTEKVPDEAELELRAVIQDIVLAHRRRYGILRVTETLRLQGRIVNHKRVERIMREDNLLAIRYRKYVLTTESQHDCQVYLNLAARMTLTGVNQLWVADLTYIRLRAEFVYLAVVIDRYSRKAVGWALDVTLAARLTITALRQAIDRRQPPWGLVHHSDQGVQYACSDYVEVLKASGIIASMSRPGNPYDNAFCESFMKTLKQEEIYCHQYRDFQELSAHLEEFIDIYYNRQRLHSALGYRTPEEFEQAAAAAPASSVIEDAATVKFFSSPEPTKSKTGSPDSSPTTGT